MTKPVCVTDSSANLLDHIWTNDLANNVQNIIICFHKSDHFPALSKFRSKTTPTFSSKTDIQ